LRLMVSQPPKHPAFRALIPQAQIKRTFSALDLGLG
jgi:hypothetical protein